MRRLLTSFIAVALTTASLAFASPVSAQGQHVNVTDSVGQFASVFTSEARQALAITPPDGFLSVLVRLNDQVDLSEILAESGQAASSEEGTHRMNPTHRR